jgi:hypothetical protein
MRTDIFILFTCLTKTALQFAGAAVPRNPPSSTPFSTSIISRIHSPNALPRQLKCELTSSFHLPTSQKQHFSLLGRQSQGNPHTPEHFHHLPNTLPKCTPKTTQMRTDIFISFTSLICQGVSYLKFSISATLGIDTVVN